MGKGGEMKCIKLLIDAWSSKITKTINGYGTLDVVPNFEDCNLKIPVDEKADLKVVIVIAFFVGCLMTSQPSDSSIKKPKTKSDDTKDQHLTKDQTIINVDK